MSDGRQMQQQVGRTTEGGMHDHGVLDRLRRHDILGGSAALFELHDRPRRLARDLQPDRLAGRRQRRVRQGEAEALGDDLRRTGCAEELAAATRRCAGAAAEFAGFLQRQFAVGETGADGLHLAGVLALGRHQRGATGHEDGRQVALGGQRHH